MIAYHRLSSHPESLLGSLIQEMPSLERMERMRWAATSLATIGPHTSPPDSVSSVSSVTCNWEVCLYLSTITEKLALGIDIFTTYGLMKELVNRADGFKEAFE
jgi:hypothetical protein